MCFRAMYSLDLYSRQIRVLKMGVLQACGDGEGRAVALDMELIAGGPFVSACHGKSGWEVWPWVQRGHVSGSTSSQEAPVCAEELGAFW